MKVSAVIPNYNNSATLRFSIESILSQTANINEFIIIDDGSTDNSLSIAKSHNINVLSLDRNYGRGFVRNTAITSVKNDIVLFLDATNTIDPTFLEKGIQWIKKQNYSAVYGKISCYSNNTAINRWKNIYLFKCRDEPLPHEVNHQGNAMLNCGACLLRRKDILNVGNFNQLMRHGEDSELGTRLNNAGFKTIGDYQMKIFCMRNDNLFTLLNRYARWYRSDKNMDLKEYIRVTLYFVKYAIKNDLKDKDFRRALISLICPYYYLLKNKFLG